jgi:hypothetical protein
LPELAIVGSILLATYYATDRLRWFAYVLLWPASKIKLRDDQAYQSAVERFNKRRAAGRHADLRDEDKGRVDEVCHYEAFLEVMMDLWGINYNSIFRRMENTVIVSPGETSPEAMQPSNPSPPPNAT